MEQPQDSLVTHGEQRSVSPEPQPAADFACPRNKLFIMFSHWSVRVIDCRNPMGSQGVPKQQHNITWEPVRNAVLGTSWSYEIRYSWGRTSSLSLNKPPWWLWCRLPWMGPSQKQARWNVFTFLPSSLLSLPNKLPASKLNPGFISPVVPILTPQTHLVGDSPR